MLSQSQTFQEAEFIQPNGRPLPDFIEACAKPYYVKHGDVRLRAMLASAPTDAPRGTIIFSPGRTEFIEKYLETVGDLLARNYTVLMVDPRGQGLSQRLLDDPLISYVADFQDYADDLAHVTKIFSPLLPKPHVLMGHSMGGTIVLQSILSGALNPQAVICSAPMLGIFELDTPFLREIIRALSFLGLSQKNLPFQKQRIGIPVPFAENKLTSDLARYENWAAYFNNEPRLRLGPPSYGWISSALRSMAYVNRNADKLKIPALIVAAGADPIVDPASNLNFARKAQAKHRVVPGAKHELMMEKDVFRDQFFESLDKFLAENAL